MPSLHRGEYAQGAMERDSRLWRHAHLLQRREPHILGLLGISCSSHMRHSRTYSSSLRTAGQPFHSQTPTSMSRVRVHGSGPPQSGLHPLCKPHASHADPLKRRPVDAVVCANPRLWGTRDMHPDSSLGTSRKTGMWCARTHRSPRVVSNLRMSTPVPEDHVDSACESHGPLLKQSMGIESNVPLDRKRWMHPRPQR